MRSLHRALRYVIPYWRWQVAALLCALLVTASEFVWPWMNKVLIDQVLWPGGGDAAHRISALNLLVVVTVSAMIAGTLLGLARSYMFARVSERAAADLRRDLFRHVHALPMAFYDRRKTGGVMSVVQNDVEALQGLYAATLVEVLTNILMVFVASGLLIWRSPTLAAIGLPVPVAFAVALALFGRPLRNAGRRVRDDTGAVQEVLQESNTASLAPKTAQNGAHKSKNSSFGPVRRLCVRGIRCAGAKGRAQRGLGGMAGR